MRRWITTLAVVLGLGIVTAPAAAQIKSVGLLAGGTFTKFGGDDAGSGDVNSNKVGFMGGGFIDIGLGDIVSIRPEIAYVQKGAKDKSGTPEITGKVDYIEVPVLLVVSVPTAGGMVRPEFFAGPAVAFKASCKITDGDVSVDCDDAGLPAKSTDFGVMFGAGLRVRNFLASVRYDLGLSNIVDLPDTSLKNRAFMILVGWSFPLISS